MSNEETLYARYISNQLTQDEIAELKQSGDWKKLEAITKAASNFTLPEMDTKSGLQKIVGQSKGDSPSESKIISLKLIWSVAASFAILLGTLFLFKGQDDILKTQYAQKTVHTFIDGSVVNLNAGSTLTFNEKKWGDQRQIELDGEAYFNVQSGKTFKVHTAYGQVEVLGTSFNVYARDQRLEVVCYDGRVRVSDVDEDIVLEAGEAIKMTLMRPSGKYTVVDERPKWTTGQSQFKNIDIREVLMELERQYDVQVKYPELNLTFSGLFVHDDLAQAILQIAKPLGLEARISDDKKVIYFSK